MAKIDVASLVLVCEKCEEVISVVNIDFAEWGADDDKGFFHACGAGFSCASLMQIQLKPLSKNKQLPIFNYLKKNTKKTE